MLQVFFKLDYEIIIDDSWFRNPAMLPTVGHKVFIVQRGEKSGESYQVTDIFWNGPDLVTIHIEKY